MFFGYQLWAMEKTTLSEDDEVILQESQVALTGQIIMEETAKADENDSEKEKITSVENEKSSDEMDGQYNSADQEQILFSTVDEHYFDDAVFIGDSRIVTLYDYAGWDNADFLCASGMTVYQVFGEPSKLFKDGNWTENIEDSLKKKTYGKIYLMVGVNELGTKNAEYYAEHYKEVVDHIRELQPDAIIYLQAIMKVTAERSAQGDYITNEGIEARNEEIAKLADDEKIFYLDVNPLICDETGGMVASYTYDGVHLKAQYIPIWLDFLKEHAVF